MTTIAARTPARVPAVQARATAPQDDLGGVPQELRNRAVKIRAEAIAAKQAGDTAAFASARNRMEALADKALELNPAYKRASSWSELADPRAIMFLFVGVMVAIVAAVAPPAGAAGRVVAALCGTGGGRGFLLFGVAPMIGSFVAGGLAGAKADRIRDAVHQEFTLDDPAEPDAY